MLKLIVCFSVLFVVSFVTADYDFNDSDFNELIFQDLTTEIEDKPLRVRRGADVESASDNPKDSHRKKAKEEKDAHCCSGEKGNPQEIEAAKEVKNKCIAEIRGESGTDDELGYDPLSCEGVQAMREKTICAAECIVKKLNLLDVNGEFKRDALLNHTRKLIGESKWKTPVLEEYLDGCLSSLKNSTTTSTEVEKEKSEKQSCNTAPLELHHCMWKKFVEGCPVEQQIDSKKCRKVRERLTKGDTSYAEKTFKKLFKHRH
ncbi:uncharacterized protein LOC129918744 [Episyrphus balteatus]|uniref:uncharacterized protein LOC129918744 n=1 Tax=Episyrphus balteatus TaxID=286459 RepID=UPI002485770C|nr:uncharacterized protein LOC129918744 [Episyrphus balteatus]